MRVAVYRNRTRRCWSVRAMEGENRGRVVSRPSSLVLRNAKPKVSEGGRRRFLETRKRSPFAVITGELLEGASLPPLEQVDWQVLFRPAEQSGFILKNKEGEVPMIQVDQAIFLPSGTVVALG